MHTMCPQLYHEKLSENMQGCIYYEHGCPLEKISINVILNTVHPFLQEYVRTDVMAEVGRCTFIDVSRLMF
jgi:uncharacterized lipoprotein YddW (UPF0748 family)